MSKDNKFKWTQGVVGHNYRVHTLSTLYPTASGIIILSLKLIRKLKHAPINKLKPKLVMLKMDIMTFWYWLQSCLRYLTAEGIILVSLRSIGQF